MRLRTPHLLAAALLGLGGCSDPSTSNDEGSDVLSQSESSGGATETGELDDESTGEPAPDACADACTETGSDGGAALCHACRCKVAFDDWLPPVEELQCANAEPIVTYHALLSETDFTLEPTEPGVIRCANPSLLTGSCRQGSKLGHLTHDDVSVYWICRDPYLEVDGRVLYHDMAVIGHNARTGATCFWDDVDDVVHEDDAPPLDLAEASEQERARSIEWFGYSDGSNCITCHDHDPFIYTPYLQSTTWSSIAADKGPYHAVDLDGSARPTDVAHLVSAPAAPCTSCHRLGSNETCSFFAPDTLGDLKINAHESEVHDATDPNSPHWRLAYWMPGGTHAFDDFAQWDATYGEAREHILRCCENPGVDGDGCEWAPVPAE